MDEVKPATETDAPAIAPEETSEDKFSALQAEMDKIKEEKENYRKAYLKETSKHSEPSEDDERLRQIAREELANSRISEIAREQEQLIKVALKENKELKLAQLNKKEPSAAVGSHSEGIPVQDTSITKEQMDFFKSKNWIDKDIERYKKSQNARR